jgi:stage III sporulation protein AG
MRFIQLSKLWKKYRYVVLIIVAGVVLMLIPTGKKKATVQRDPVPAVEETFSLEETEQKMENILGQIEGVGKIHVMLTLSSGSQLQLASDLDLTKDGAADQRRRQETVTLNRGSGYQEVIVTRQFYPVYRGAVVVCQGADKSSVRLAVIEAVSALTGLSADKISVVKWKQS